MPSHLLLISECPQCAQSPSLGVTTGHPATHPNRPFPALAHSLIQEPGIGGYNVRGCKRQKPTSNCLP